MADINNVISLGIGSPASIEHFILFGLSVSPETAPVVGYGDPVIAATRLTIAAETRKTIYAAQRPTIEAQ